MKPASPINPAKPTLTDGDSTRLPQADVSAGAPVKRWLGALVLGACAATMLPATASATDVKIKLASHEITRSTTSHNSSEWPSVERRHGSRHGSNRSRRSRSTEVYARVVDVSPMYREVRISEPRRECTTEYVRDNDHRYRTQSTRRSQNHGSPLLGTIVGGAIGNRIGRHFGGEARLGATIAGAVIGTAIGNRGSGSAGYDSRRQLIANDGHYRDRFRDDRGRRSDRGNRNHSHDDYRPLRPVERCRTRTVIRTEEKIDGYRVSYRYHGRVYQTTTREHPGDRLLIEVNVRPAHRG